MAKRFDQLSPAGKATVIDLFCRRYGYGMTDANGNVIADPNETKVQFVQRLAQQWLVVEAIHQRVDEAARAASATAASDADIT